MHRALTALFVAGFCLLLSAPVTHSQTTEADVYVNQAIVDLDDKKYDEALANLEQALQREPDHVEALYYMGVVHMARRQPADAVPFLERAHAGSPSDAAITYQLALAYFAQQQYERARPLLEEAFRVSPELDGLGYYVGFVRYRDKDYRGALAAFRAGRSSDPEIQQLTRFYSALALGVLGLPGQATAEVEQALRVAPGSQIAAPAERLLDTLNAVRATERAFSAEVRFGVSYDDNVIVRPDPSNSEPLVAPLRRRAHESIVELFAFRADYTWYRTADWESSVGLSFFGTYVNSLPSFNLMDPLINLSLTRKTSLGPLPAQFGLQYTFDDLFLDEKDFIKRHTVTATGALVEGAMHLTQAFARFQAKDFADPEPPPIHAEIRTGQNWMVGFLHLVRFEQDRHFLKVGYQLDWDDTVGQDYEYLGHRISAGGQYTLPWYDIRLKYDFDLHLRRYQHNNAILPSTAPGTRKREDEEMTHDFRIEYPVAYAARWLCGPWGDVRGRTDKCVTLTAEYQASRVNSNLAVFDFTRNVFSLILSWTY